MAGFLAGNPTDVVQSARIGEETFETIADNATALNWSGRRCQIASAAVIGGSVQAAGVSKLRSNNGDRKMTAKRRSIVAISLQEKMHVAG
jgi:hypothetical protein